MNKHLLLSSLSCLFGFLLSCNEAVNSKITSKHKQNIVSEKPAPIKAIDPYALSKDFSNWYNYTYLQIRLAQDFTGLNADSSRIDKSNFLQQLISGHYIPIKITSTGLPVYKLYRVNGLQESVRSTLKQMASTELAHFNMEGKDFPAFNFSDVNGHPYTSKETRGRLVLWKCWFIRCIACVKEFPELNELVDQYKDRKDILFISLAIDKKEDLIPFLKKNPFKYAVIPEKGPFMENQLSIGIYPTHILAGPDGEILKVTNSIEDLKPFLIKYASHGTVGIDKSLPH